jgi:hypothetical protein
MNIWLPRALCTVKICPKKDILELTYVHIGDLIHINSYPYRNHYRSVRHVVLYYNFNSIFNISVHFDTNIYMSPLMTKDRFLYSVYVHGVVYSTQHYVIKFVSDLRQVGGFLGMLQCSIV